jgi:hypothetical protein
MAAARRMIDEKPHDYVLPSYVAGLAVESILQALALQGGGAHDAKHALPNWLSKCPSPLHDALKGSGEWNQLVALWTMVYVISPLTRCSAISGTRDTCAAKRVA